MSTIRVVNIQHTDATEPNIVLESDGTTTFASGITISGGTNLTVSGTAEFASGTASAPGITFIDDNNTGIFEPAADNVAITTSGTERLRVDNLGNVGIGVTNAGQRLVVGSASNTILRIDNADDSTAKLYFHNSGSTDMDISVTSSEMIFSGGSNERMRIDNSGNLGIGTTTPGKTLEVSNSATDGGIRVRTTTTNVGDESRIEFAQNGQGGGNNIVGVVRGISAASNSGELAFNTVASGSGTERMRIDSSGRVLVGRTASYTTDTSVKLQIQDSSGPRISLSAGQVSAGSLLGAIDFGADEGQGRAAARISAYSEADFNTDDHPAQLRFETTPDDSGTRVQRMRLTADGYLQAKGNNSSYHSFVGHQIVSDRNDTMLLINNTATSITAARGGIHLIYDISPNSVNAAAIAFDDSSGPRFAVRSNGGIANYQSNDSNLCDEREKKNIEPLNSTWNCLKNWDLKKFHYNEDSDTDNKRYGVIAQQVAEGCPELITEWIKQEAADAVLDDEGNVVTPAKQQIVRMGVKEQQMMWMSIKALQEAIAKIETLEAKVAALEAA